MEEKQAKQPEGLPANFLTGVWKFFTSLKLTVFLLISLAMVSIIGTVVDQTDPAKNMKMLVDMFGPQDAPGALDWLVKLGLTDMYHSWWFVGLLSMLSANITICSLERFPGVWKKISAEQGPLTDETLKTISQRKEFKAGSAASYKEKAIAAMKSCGYSPKMSEENGALHLYAESGKYSRLGVYITHTSVIVIFLGAMAGSFWGYKGYVQIVENGSIDQVSLMSKPLLKKYPGDVVPLNFRVRCDKFELAQHQQARFRGMPSDYLSTLTVIKDDKEVLTKTIQVNDPLQYEHIRFYQSSYGQAPGMAVMTIRATGRSGGFSVKDYNIKKGDHVKIEGSDYEMEITDMAADVALGPNNQLVAQSDQFKGMGAAAMQFYDKDHNMVDQVVISNVIPDSQPRNIPYTFVVTNYKGPYYTGLQVAYDPGVWVVWLGCTLMVSGILVAFFMFHKRVWVRIQTTGGSTVVTVAGSSNKNKHAFEREFSKLVEKLQA